MIEEIFLHLSGPSSALPAMVQILADFASANGYLSNIMHLEVWFIFLGCFWRLQFG
jgi:hypothetical protein